MGLPSVDIVIVNWNAGAMLRDCLQAIAASQLDECKLGRVVVVDNASSDNSAGSLDYPGLPLVLISNPQNRGFAVACNQGAAGSEADYLLFLNPDTRVHPDALQRSVLFMEDPPHPRVGISGAQLLDDTENVCRCCSRLPTTSTFVAKMLGLNRLMPSRFPDHFCVEWDHRDTREVEQVMGAYLLIRRPLFQALHGFDERFFVYFEDVDLSLRARRAGWTSWHHAGAQVYHKGRGTSEQVRARRLFYSLRSRLLYAFKNFSPGSAAALLAATLLLEPLSRVVAALMAGSLCQVGEVLKAYCCLCASLPTILRASTGVPVPAAAAAARARSTTEA